MMTKNWISVAALIAMAAIHGNCQDKPGQVCNKQTFDRSLDKYLPKDACVPTGQAIDDVIRDVDFNRDGKPDLVLKHTKFPLEENTPVYFSIFQTVNDTTLQLVAVLSNLLPPFLRNIYATLASGDSTLIKIVHAYSYDTQVEFIADTIKISHMIPQDYGKTYEFVYQDNVRDWRLQRTIFWIGGLDARFVERMNWPQKMTERNPLEFTTPTLPVSIQNFDLIESRRSADNSESKYLSNKYNPFDWVKKNDK